MIEAQSSLLVLLQEKDCFLSEQLPKVVADILFLMQRYLILARWSVSMHILPLSLILCVPLQVWVGDREREVGREREGDSLILNVTEFTEVNALSHLIQIIYKIMVSLPLRPVVARRLKIITSTQNAYVSLKCQRRSQCFIQLRPSA